MKLPELNVALRLTESAGQPSNVWFNDRPVHSIKNSEQEFQRFISTNLDQLPNQSKVLLIGAGALFDRLLPTAKRLQLTIYEPVIQLRQLYSIQTQLNLLDIASFKLSTKFDAVIVLPAYRRMFANLIQNLEEIFTKSATLANQIDQKTTNKFLRQWMRNYSIHISDTQIHYLTRISPTPKAVLFCGAGPTLFHDLEKHRLRFSTTNNKPFIVCADTIAAALIYDGWPVDLILSIDSGFGTSFHLSLLVKVCKNLQIEPPPVLTWLAGSLFLTKANLKTIYVSTLFPPDQILAASLQLPPPFTNQFRNLLGYAVALTELNSQKKSELLLAGVGFTGQRSRFYCRGSGYDFYYLTKQNRLNPIETQSYKLESTQKKANQIAKAELQKLLSQPKFNDLNDQEPPNQYSIELQSESTVKLLKILKKSQITDLLSNEFGPKWATYSRRYFSFLD